LRVTVRAKHFVAHRQGNSQRVLAGKIVEVQSSPACCERDGLLWDVVTVYQPDAVWTETLPFASVFDGPVVNA
jgi:hypothetical protein